MRRLSFFISIMGVCLLTACGKAPAQDLQIPMHPIKTEIAEQSDSLATKDTDLLVSESNTEAGGKNIQDTTSEVEEISFIDPNGQELALRILPPNGYERIPAEEGSFLQYCRAFPVKEDGSKVLLHDGSEKSNQDAHVAVLNLPIENADLQQCADSIMRMYAEYFLETGQEDRIKFHFTNGFEAVYTKWRDGYRIKVEGNQVSWVHSAEYDDSYETFVKYMRMVFSYAGTLSMDGEADPVSLNDITAGDVFLKGGSPGHVVMVVDVCENEQGQKAFLLAQGYMPAQEFHVLKNPASDTDPWYYVDEVKYPFLTPEYAFDEGSLQRIHY